MQTTKLPTGKIKANTGQIDGLPQNPRFIKDERFAKLVKSLQELPELLQARPVIVYPFNGEFVAIAGNMRHRAAKELKWKEIDCCILPTETPAEKLREIAIKDNIGFGSDDYDILANEWEATELAEWGMELGSFGEGSNLDYSDKNQEIDVDDFSDKMVLKLEYSSEDFQKVKSQLQKIGTTAENALYNFLFPNEPTPF